MEQVDAYQIIHSKVKMRKVSQRLNNVKTMLDPLMDQRVTRAERMHSQHNLIIQI